MELCINDFFLFCTGTIEGLIVLYRQPTLLTETNIFFFLEYVAKIAAFNLLHHLAMKKRA